MTEKNLKEKLDKLFNDREEYLLNKSCDNIDSEMKKCTTFISDVIELFSPVLINDDALVLSFDRMNKHLSPEQMKKLSEETEYFSLLVRMKDSQK